MHWSRARSTHSSPEHGHAYDHDHGHGHAPSVVHLQHCSEHRSELQSLCAAYLRTCSCIVCIDNVDNSLKNISRARVVSNFFFHSTIFSFILHR